MDQIHPASWAWDVVNGDVSSRSHGLAKRDLRQQIGESVGIDVIRIARTRLGESVIHG